MALNKLLLSFFFLLVCGQAAAFSNFEIDCEISPEDVEIKWLKYHFKTESCKEIREKLTKVKSFNQFMFPDYKAQTLTYGSWLKFFPEFTGVKYDYDRETVGKILNIPDHLMFNAFKNILRYTEFSDNITVLDFSYGYRFKKNYCLILEYFRKTKYVVVDMHSMEELSKCKPERVPLLIYVGQLLGGGAVPKHLHDKIAGAESFTGMLEQLGIFTNLQFVGLRKVSYPGLGSLATNQNITHLSINDPDYDDEDIGSLSELINLTYLSLTCIENERGLIANNEAPTLCKKPFVQNINFIKDMEWLESLVIPFNGLEDVSILSEMVNLKHIDVSNNNIKKMPDFQKLKNLKTLKKENNPSEFN